MGGDCPIDAPGCISKPASGPAEEVVDHVKMLAVEAHYLRAHMASLEKSVSSINCGFQHVLEFFSCEDINLQKSNANTWLDFQKPNLSEVCGSGVETDDDVSNIDFYSLLDTSDEVGSSSASSASVETIIASQRSSVETFDVEMCRESTLHKMTECALRFLKTRDATQSNLTSLVRHAARLAAE